ncbi:hypothetical protein KIW84_043543 [Lathyrus oleraceus]|uniref:Retrotransposon gag domain-containing protein n=1 Tax=Pisum sativum TaxID=3888 RepID=A0A9D5AU62_PEA|nr:hypothetical protein KIW84_043543 [Pisum sativum]
MRLGWQFSNSSRDVGDPRKKTTTAGVVINNGGGFGFAAGGGPGPVVNNLKDSQFPPFFGAEEDREEDQFSVLVEKIRALESYATPGVANLSNMGLVEGIVIPQKFKAPAFDKYNGSSCPETHLQAFVRKISAYTMDQKLWMYFFQDSLSGGSLEWYTKLRSSDIKSWKDLGDAFFKQYQFNADMAPSRTQLQDQEISDLFMGTLQGTFAERMVGCPVTNFADIVVAGERIESWLKMGRIQGSASSSGSKKPFGSGQRKKEGDTSAVYTQRGQGRDRYYQHTAAVTILADNSPAQQHQQQ